MTNLLAPVAKSKFFANNGQPAVGYKLFTYRAGTDTKADTFPSAGAVIANPNPITLDYRGECNLWIPPNVAYKFVFTPPNDTDPPTAPIWTVDNIVDSQLVTLWGGVDTGAANAYILNFTANFTQYQDGIVIYWIPSNTNTGSSTINVNGLGPVMIKNQDGSFLEAGQIAANQTAEMIYQGTGFVLLSSFGVLSSGSFSVTVSGLTAPGIANLEYLRIGNTVTITCLPPGEVGESDSNSLKLNDIPDVIRPRSPRVVICSGAVDDGLGQIACSAEIRDTGEIVLNRSVVSGTAVRYSATGWTPSGSKGISEGFFVTYII